MPRTRAPHSPTVVVGLLLLGAFCLSACGPSQGAVPPRPRPAPIAVRVVTVAQQDVTYAIRAVGSLQADEVVQVTAEVEGAVRDVSFNEGDSVTSSKLLARVDPERYSLEAARAEAAYRKADAARAQAEAELDRRVALSREDLISDEELSRAKQQLDQAQGEAGAARAARDIAQENSRRAAVRAPRRGLVNTKTVETGKYVKQGDVLATIVDASRLRLRFMVSEAESVRARVGQNITFHVAALKDRAFAGRIYHVGAVADPQTRQVEILAWVPNPGVLKPGFFAEVELPAETHGGALVVPEAAVRATEGGFGVFVVDKGVAQLRKVTPGLHTSDGRIEMLSGLAAGDHVVIEGSDRLAHGVPVRAAE